MSGCFPKLAFLLAKRQEQQAEAAAAAAAKAAKAADTTKANDTKAADTTEANDAMSKPDKYKNPSEKGPAVPGTASSSVWKPFTFPYTGTGIKRSASGTHWVSLGSPKEDGFAASSHAAPPLYITDDLKKKDQPVDKKGKQSAGSVGKKDKKAADETHMFKGGYIASRVKPEDRQPIE